MAALVYARQRGSATLFRHGLHYDQKTRGAGVHRAWSYCRRLAAVTSETAFAAEYETKALLAAQVAQLDADITTLATDCGVTVVTINTLMCFPGISLTTYLGWPWKFGFHPVHSSGDALSQVVISKAGNSYARKLLVEAVWSHAKPCTRPIVRLRDQFDKVNAGTRIRAIEGSQQRHWVCTNYEARHKRILKASTAVACALAGWCWSVRRPLASEPAGLS